MFHQAFLTTKVAAHDEKDHLLYDDNFHLHKPSGPSGTYLPSYGSHIVKGRHMQYNSINAGARVSAKVIQGPVSQKLLKKNATSCMRELNDKTEGDSKQILLSR